MKAKVSLALVISAGIAGFVAGEIVLRSAIARQAIGRMFGRGELRALVQGKGIYEIDVARAVAQMKSRGTDEPADQTNETVKRTAWKALVANARLDELAGKESIPLSSIDREYGYLQYQLRPKQAWLEFLHANHFSQSSLRAEIGKDLRARQWIEQQIAPQTTIAPETCARYFETHRKIFVQPQRFRARHIFLAAPPETPPEVIEKKHVAITTLSDRIKAGEKLADLAPTASEDEASRGGGGDLGFFSEERMPPDFIAAVKAMAVGQTGPVVRTRLGFHIIQLTAVAPHREMTLEEAEPAVRLGLENEKRRGAVEAVQAALSQQIGYLSELSRPAP